MSFAPVNLDVDVLKLPRLRLKLEWLTFSVPALWMPPPKPLLPLKKESVTVSVPEPSFPLKLHFPKKPVHILSTWAPCRRARWAS